MKDMKKRIVALILTVVMSLLALTSCGDFDFAEENLNDYAEFNYAEFKAALEKLEIEDGSFTADAATRNSIVAANIYNTVANKIIADTDEEDWVKSGELSAGAVLYFVYYAVDSDGNQFFVDQMNKSSITASSTKANHVINLGDFFEKKDYSEFIKLIKDNLNTNALTGVYTMLTASDLQTKAEEDLKESNPDATDDEISDAKAEAIKVKAGDKIYISYTRTYTKTSDEGVETSVTEKASYELITLDPENILHGYFLASDSVANVGSALEVFDSKVDDTVKTKKTFNVTMDEITYTYSDVTILWKVEGDCEPIATFEYAPYADIEDDSKEVSPSSCYSSAIKVDLKDKALTYYVYPVYAINTPAYEEITAYQLLYYVYGNSLTAKSFDILEDKTFKNGEESIDDLLADIADIYDTNKENNEFYGEDTDLKKLLDAYNEAVEDGGDSPTTDQKTAINEAKEALADAQTELLKGVIAKIAAATSGDKNLGTEICNEYFNDTFYSLKTTYDSEIVENVQKAVWKLIDESVTVISYPEDLLKEYCDHIYETYEYEFYKGDFDTDSSNRDEYGTLQNYLETTLSVVGKDKINEAIEKEAKEALEPIIKIFLVAQMCKDEAVAALSGENGYVELDIKGGVYEVDEDSVRELYGDMADEKIAELEETAKENIESARADADKFLVDDDYMKDYKKEVGSTYYKQLCEDYGEINLRMTFQVNRLFYYLTSANVQFNETEGVSEYKYTDDGCFIDFRTVKYTIAAEETDAE